MGVDPDVEIVSQLLLCILYMARSNCMLPALHVSHVIIDALSDHSLILKDSHCLINFTQTRANLLLEMRLRQAHAMQV